jgi:hypothetical protein
MHLRPRKRPTARRSHADPAVVAPVAVEIDVFPSDPTHRRLE